MGWVVMLKNTVLFRYSELVLDWLEDVNISDDEAHHIRLGYTRSYDPRRTANEILSMRKNKEVKNV